MVKWLSYSLQFNIGIEDNHEILTETRRVLSEVKILSDHTLNLEISLKTRDGDSMVLEVWSANMDTASAKCKNTRVSEDNKWLRTILAPRHTRANFLQNSALISTCSTALSSPKFVVMIYGCNPPQPIWTMTMKWHQKHIKNVPRRSC